MANESSKHDDPIEVLMKEAETLKQKLDEERQKLNDVTCIFTKIYIFFN